MVSTAPGPPPPCPAVPMSRSTAASLASTTLASTGSNGLCGPDSKVAQCPGPSPSPPCALCVPVSCSRRQQRWPSFFFLPMTMPVTTAFPGGPTAVPREGVDGQPGCPLPGFPHRNWKLCHHPTPKLAAWAIFSYPSLTSIHSTD